MEQTDLNSLLVRLLDEPSTEHNNLMASTGMEAEKCGFVVVEDIHDKCSLIELARSLGSPVRNADGNFIKELRVMPCAIARPRTLSAIYGTGDFPLHTDTAFWSVPARFLIMRAVGESRRPTTICSFPELFALAGKNILAAIRKSIWMLKTSEGPVYCEMVLHFSKKHQGFRYDRQCMIPANSSAQIVDEYMQSELHNTAIQQISWSGKTAVVIANWQALHGRGPEPLLNEARLLERVYVR